MPGREKQYKRNSRKKEFKTIVWVYLDSKYQSDFHLESLKESIISSAHFLGDHLQVFRHQNLSNTIRVAVYRTSLRGMGTLLPAFGESIGLDNETSVYLVSIMSLADFSGRCSLIMFIFTLPPLLQNHQPYNHRLIFSKCCKKVFFCLLYSHDVSCHLLSWYDYSAIYLYCHYHILGMFVHSFLGAVLCCVLFGVGIGGVAAFMNVIFAESLGIEIIQVAKIRNMN